MKKRKTLLTLTAAILLFTSLASAVGQYPKVQQKDTNQLQIQQTPIQKQGILQQITGLLSFSEVQNTYAPGERAEIRVKATAEQEFNTENAVKVVEIYHCHDTGCDDPPPIKSSSEDSCSTEEWYPTYDDCTAKFTETASFSTTMNKGETWSWGVEFDAPSQTGQYILVGYIYKNGIVTDVSKEKFTVEEQGINDRDGDNVADSVDQCPDTYGERDDGCPVNQDSDSDGVFDRNDACPQTAGSGSDGCPTEDATDSDNDGVVNTFDQCPETKGSRSNNGCPSDDKLPTGVMILAAGFLVLGGAVYLWLN